MPPKEQTAYARLLFTYNTRAGEVEDKIAVKSDTVVISQAILLVGIAIVDAIRDLKDAA